MSSSHAPLFKFRNLMYHVKRAVGGAGGRKHGLVQADEYKSSRSVLKAVIKVKYPLISLDMYYVQVNQTPGPARSHSLILLKKVHIYWEPFQDGINPFILQFTIN